MFGNEEEFLDWMDDDEISKIQREALKKQAEIEKEYIRLNTMYVYFESMQGLSKDKFLYFEENIVHLDNMLKAFIAKEEYEKCVNIRDWMIRAEEIKNNSNTRNNKSKPKKSKQITF